MTDKEKAKAYDEAMYRVKHFLTVIGVSPDDEPIDVAKRMSEYVFPELKESENERIRKAIIELVKMVDKNPIHQLFGYGDITYSDMIAWLEKQDSYYSFEIKEGHWYKCICDYMLNNSDLMFKNDRLYYCRSDWRLRGEIDERNVKDIGVKGYRSFFRPATNQEIKDWLEKQGEQTPTWSEEDEKYLKLAIDNFQMLGNSFLTTWLKSLKGRVQLQQEWSEDDNFMVENVRNSFGLHCGQMTPALQEQYRKFFDKVKAIKLQPNWKPSKEQIKSLYNSIPDAALYEREILTQLYVDLKKLREE